jgi:chromosome partitioning protein
MKVIAISNQKGGVGKTTTAVNLSTAIAITGKKVLLIDLDPQGNASTSLNIKVGSRNQNIYRVMSENMDINLSKITTSVPGLDIIPSVVDLAVLEKNLYSQNRSNFVLKQKINKLKLKYDFIFLDCSPSLGALTLNALTAANSILIPVQCEFLAMEGLAHLLSTIRFMKNTTNKSLSIEGIVLMMTERRRNLCEQVEGEIRRQFGKLVYKTTIPRNIKLAEAPSHGMPAIMYNTKCSGSVSFLMLTKEFLFKNHPFV